MKGCGGAEAPANVTISEGTSNTDHSITTGLNTDERIMSEYVRLPDEAKSIRTFSGHSLNEVSGRSDGDDGLSEELLEHSYPIKPGDTHHPGVENKVGNI
jgi:hypothetical protein